MCNLAPARDTVATTVRLNTRADAQRYLANAQRPSES